MAASQSDPHHREPGQRRPMCGVCTKPLRLCLCSRFRAPPLDTTVGVTILQHAMEAQHPLSSIRVARLGLLNLAVTQVTDVNHRARFFLRTLDGPTASNPGDGRADLGASSGHIGMLSGDVFGRSEGERSLAMRSDGINSEFDGQVNVRCDSEKVGISSCGHLGEEDTNIAGITQIGGEGLDFGEISNGVSCDLGGEVGGAESGDQCFRLEKMKTNEHHTDFERPVSAVHQFRNSVASSVNCEEQHRIEVGVTNKVNGDLPHPIVENNSGFQRNGICKEYVEADAAVGQGCNTENMDKCSIAYTEKELRIDIERGVKPKIRWLSRRPLGREALANGFVVTKIQTKKSKLTAEVSEFEEFSITIPPQSALLFPCQRAISIDASDCQIGHLIVLDGTWAKAQRMYHENPWLQLLPHVKLESDGVSLYNEVRHEPKAGCLSTIESIVVAMKKLGEDSKGLDDILDVFGSMIADQRRCKEENWEQKLKSQP